MQMYEKNQTKHKKVWNFVKSYYLCHWQDETREGQLNFICTQKEWLVSGKIYKACLCCPLLHFANVSIPQNPSQVWLAGVLFYLTYIFEIWERELIRVGSIIPTQLQPLQYTHRIFIKYRLCATHILWPQTNPVGQPTKGIKRCRGGLKATHQKGDVITTFRGKILEFPLLFNLWLLVVWGIKRPPYGLIWLY